MINIVIHNPSRFDRIVRGNGEFINSTHSDRTLDIEEGIIGIFVVISIQSCARIIYPQLYEQLPIIIEIHRYLLFPTRTNKPGGP